MVLAVISQRDPVAGLLDAIAHHAADAAAEVLGPDSLDLERSWMLDRLSSLSYTIAAGTSQIQQNIVAERILGLPKGR